MFALPRGHEQVNGQVPAECVGGAAPGVLVRPATFKITWALAGTGGVLGPFTKGSKQDPPASVELPSVELLPDVRLRVRHQILCPRAPPWAAAVHLYWLQNACRWHGGLLSCFWS